MLYGPLHLLWKMRNYAQEMLKALSIIITVFNTVLIPVQFGDKELVSTDEEINRFALECASYLSGQFHGDTYYSLSVCDKVTLGKDLSYYGGNSASEIDSRCHYLVKNACTLADPAINFGKFCNRTRSTVDLVVLYVAGGSEADGDGADCFWPQFSSLSKKEATFYLDASRIDNFIICPELSRGDVADIGRLCHEFGHFLGFPDFYDTDRKGSGGLVENAIGKISLMDSGYHLEKGCPPPPFTAIEREIAGTGNCIPLVPGEYTIVPDYDFFRLDGHTDGEYYLVEFNSTANALVSYYIDKSEADAGYSDRQGCSLTAKRRWELNEVNCNPGHPCARIAEGGYSFNDKWQSPIIISDIEMMEGRVSIKVTEAVLVKDFRPYQDGAAIRFNILCAGNATTSCTVEWYQEGLIRSFQEPLMINGELFSVLDGKLDPAKDCSFIIRLYYEDGSWFAYEQHFRTSWWQKEGIPFITFDRKDRNPGGSFIKGAIIPLKVWNMPQQQACEWYFNGRHLEQRWLCLDESGELRAEVTSSDGSTQILVKQIIAE